MDLSEVSRLSRLWASGITEAIGEIASLAPELVPFGPLLHNQLLNDPLYVRYTTESPARNEKPWHAIGSQRWAARAAINAGYGDGSVFTLSPELVRWGHDDPSLPAPVVGLMLAGAILNAQPFLWSNRAESRLENTLGRRDKPRAIQRSLLPAPLTFWARESSLASTTDSHQRQDWLLLIDQGPGCLAMVANVRHVPTGRIGHLVDGLPTDEPLPPGSGARLLHIAAVISGMLDQAADPKRASRQAAPEAGPKASVVIIKGGVW